MPIRPAQARWFETYLPRNQTVRGVEVLAGTGAVELEADPRQVSPVEAGKLRYFVERFQHLAGMHAHDMPRVGGKPSALEGDPIRVANQALHLLRAWCDRVDLAHARLEHLQAELHHLLLLQECVEAMAGEDLELDKVFSRTRFLCKCLFACPRQDIKVLAPGSGAELLVRGRERDFLFVASLTDQRHVIRKLAVEQGCEQIAIPVWLSGGPLPQKTELRRRIAEARGELAQRKRELRALRCDAEVAQASADVGTLRWYLAHAADTLGKGPMNHVTGWTTAANPEQLRHALARAGIQAIIRCPHPPQQSAAPVASTADWWAQPFRPLVELLGPPGRQEVDPSGLLALVVPLLFGYMFPDMGHGLVLAALALAVSRRHPEARFLIPCGLSAAAFGVLAGDLFGLHGLIPPLWASPLEEPFLVLSVPLGFGAVLILLGQILAGVQARWRGEGWPWLARDAAMALLYVAVLAGLFYPKAYWLAALAVLQFLTAGVALMPAGRRVSGLPGLIGDLVLGAFELGLNTLSFVRVGAFALGHTALSHAVVTLAQGTGSLWGWWLVMLLGNVFILAMEGLVVFVQTTRLVLFEFFIRFLRGEGRAFRPVQHPPVAGRRKNEGQSA